MARRIVFAAVVAAACKSQPSSLADGIVGAWDEWCRTAAEATSTCSAKADVNVMHTFKADGTLALSLPGRNEPPMTGTWKLDGNDLAMSYTGGGAALTERYRARIEGGHLVLWKPDSKFGTVFGRHGEPFVAGSATGSSAPH